MLVIVNLETANFGSILNMFKRIGVSAVISSDPKVIEDASKLVLPGVGAFDNAMTNLKRLNLIEVLNHKVLQEKTPVLGVCLGMQLLTERSEEGKELGLGWIKGETVRFRFDDLNSAGKQLKVPHMGWNHVFVRQPNALFREMYDEPRFYFVHSYHVRCQNSDDILTTTHHGLEFVSSVSHGNVYGTQYHPEKSHKFGLKLYSNFVNHC